MDITGTQAVVHTVDTGIDMVMGQELPNYRKAIIITYQCTTIRLVTVKEQQQQV